jgi:hypothetical protein
MSETNGHNGANSSASNFRVIGTRPIRHDGADKVTGVQNMVLIILFLECCTGKSSGARTRTRGSRELISLKL